MEKEPRCVEISTGIVWRTLLIVLAVWFFYAIRSILLLLFVALVIVSAAQPIIDKLEKKKIPRTVTALILFFFFFSFVTGVLYLIIPALVEELRQLAENVPYYFEGINRFFANLSNFAASYNFEPNLEKFSQNASAHLADSLSAIFSNTLGFLLGIIKTLIVFSLSFYMLVKKDGIQGFLKAIVPLRHQRYVIDLSNRIQAKIGRWLIGQLVLMLIIFGLDYLVLILLGVPYALILAFIGGILEIIPYIGPTMALIPAVLIGLTVSPLVAFLVALFYIAIQQAENYVITPLVMKKAVGLNPVVIILALLIGGKIAGGIGLLIAVPFATALYIFWGDIVQTDSEAVNNP